MLTYKNSTINLIVVFCLIAGTHFFLLPSAHANHLPKTQINSYLADLNLELQIEYPDGWFYTLDQMRDIYHADYKAGKRLENHIRHHEGKYLAQCNGHFFEIPERFIQNTLRLLEELLDKKLARFLFRLDAFHCHPFVPDNVFNEKYLNLNTSEMIKLFTQEESLGVLFHNAEHLASRNPPRTGPIDERAQKLISNRNVVGWYDKKNLMVLKPDKSELVGSGKSNTAIIPKGYRSVGSIVFMATKNGVFNIQHDGQDIRLDISLYESYYH